MNVITSLNSLAFIPGVPGGPELLVIGGIALLLFGNRLPGAAKSLGQSFSAFKKGIKEGVDDEDDSRPQRREEESRLEKQEVDIK